MKEKNTPRRDLLNEIGLENSIVFENPDYDSAIIGYDDNSSRIVYDYEKMIEHLMEEEGEVKIHTILVEVEVQIYDL